MNRFVIAYPILILSIVLVFPSSVLSADCTVTDLCEDFDSLPVGPSIVNSDSWSVDQATILVVNNGEGGKALATRGPGGISFLKGRKVAFDYERTSQISVEFDLQHISRLNMSRASDRLSIGLAQDNVRSDLNSSEGYFLFAQTVVDVQRDSPNVEVSSFNNNSATFDGSNSLHFELVVDLQDGTVSLSVDDILIDSYLYEFTATIPAAGNYLHQLGLEIDGGETALIVIDNIEIRTVGATQQFDILSKFSDEDPALASHRANVGENLELETQPLIPEATPWAIKYFKDGIETPYTQEGVGGIAFSSQHASFPEAEGFTTVGVTIGNATWMHGNGKRFIFQCPPTQSRFTGDMKDCDGDGLSNEAESIGRGVDGDDNGTYDYEPAKDGAKLNVPTIMLEVDYEQGLELSELAARVAAIRDSGQPDSVLRLPRDIPRDILWATKKVFFQNGIQFIYDRASIEEIPRTVIDQAFTGYDALMQAVRDAVGDEESDAANQAVAQLIANFWMDANVDQTQGVCGGAIGSAELRSETNCLAQQMARSGVYRYVLIASGFDNNTRSGANIGPFILQTLGGSSLQRARLAPSDLVSSDAGTLMHEIGHSLGLLHGGGDRVQCKPNYPSVMNYLYQTPKYAVRRPLNYSSGLAEPFNEAAVTESDPVFLQGFPAMPLQFNETKNRFVLGTPDPNAGFFGVDWNGDGIVATTPYGMNYNFLFSTSQLAAGSDPAEGICDSGDPVEVSTLMQDHNDWEGLDLTPPQLRMVANNVLTREPDVDVLKASAFVSLSDLDGDNIAFEQDNCALDANTNQFDSDMDGIGDVCDICPNDFDSLQVDTDLDGIGDACDVMSDAPSRIAENDSWLQVTLPADVYGATIAEVFGAALPTEQYGIQWIMFDYDVQTQAYRSMLSTEELLPGRGYWFIQITGQAVTLVLPPSLYEPQYSRQSECIDTSLCVVTGDLIGTEVTKDVTWAMVGNPYPSEYAFNDILLLIEGDSGTSTAPLRDRVAAGDNSVIFTYDANIEDYLPIVSGTSIPPWTGGWLGTAIDLDVTTEQVRVQF